MFKISVPKPAPLPKQKTLKLKEQMFCPCGEELILVNIYGRGRLRHGVWCPRCNITDAISEKYIKEE